MSTSLERMTLVAKDLFTDVLGEPFCPECDPQGRQHTLGRLAIATFLKGKNLEVENAEYFHYRPSWAAETEVYALSREIDDLTVPANALHIQSRTDSSYLDVSQFIDLSHGVSVTLAANHESTRFDHLEEMGDRLVIARRTIARAAFEAFNYAVPTV